MVDERWEDVSGFGGRYQISSRGRVLNNKTGRYLTASIGQLKYVYVKLSHKGDASRLHLHRLLAIAFLKNDDPLNKVVVHHRDHNRTNYDLLNLVWTTPRDNSIKSFTEGGRVGKGYMTGRTGGRSLLSKKVRQLDMHGNEISIINGISEAARLTGGNASSIVRVCKGKLNSHNGFKWEYV